MSLVLVVSPWSLVVVLAILLCIIGAVTLVNAAIVWYVISTFVGRRPTRKELIWLWSSWRNPLTVVTWCWMTWAAVYLILWTLKVIHHNTWAVPIVAGLLLMVIGASGKAMRDYYRAQLSPGRPCVSFDIERTDDGAYELVAINTLDRDAYDVRAEILDGDLSRIGAPIIDLLQGRGIARLRPAGTRYALGANLDYRAADKPITLRVSWQDSPTLPDDKLKERPKRRRRCCALDPYEVQLRATPGDEGLVNDSMAPLALPASASSAPAPLPTRRQQAGRG